MSDTKALIEILQICEKYGADYVSAEHDIIYLGPDPFVMSDEDIENMENLGCHRQEEYECWGYYT